MRKDDARTPSLQRSNSQPSSSSSANSVRLRSSAEELEGVFKRFDANGDGKISCEELGAIMNSFGYNAPPEELRRMLKAVDSDGDGFIDLQEFVELNTQGINKGGTLQDLKDAFRLFDLDKSGSISALELHKVLKGMGDSSTVEDCHNMIKSVDRDGDGLVNFQEFKMMMMTTKSSA